MTSSYTYTADNQLVVAGSATFAYDPLDRLYRQGASGTLLRYAGDDVVSELDTSGTYKRRYVPGDAGDEPLVWNEGTSTGTRRWFHQDERGSVVTVSDASGAASILTYDEYGIPGKANAASRFGYTGQTWLSEVGLYHYKARTYSPTLGRFMQSDPIHYGDGMNIYAYVGNNPVNFIDPTGLDEKADARPNTDDIITDDVIVNGHHVGPVNIRGSLGSIGISLGLSSVGFGPSGGATAGKGSSSGITYGFQKTIRCTGRAYVMQGNSNLIGKEGFPHTPVTNGSAAIIPRQFTGQLTAGPTMREIGRGASGTLTAPDGRTQRFNTFTDSVAEVRLGTTLNAQNTIMARDPGAVVFEVVGGTHYGAGSTFDITIPNINGCPVGSPK